MASLQKPQKKEGLRLTRSFTKRENEERALIAGAKATMKEKFWIIIPFFWSLFSSEGSDRNITDGLPYSSIPRPLIGNTRLIFTTSPCTCSTNKIEERRLNGSIPSLVLDEEDHGKRMSQEWIKEYEQRSETVWRVQRTHKSTGRLNVYKGDFRCQHNVQQVSKHVKESKNTGCPAVLKITIQRYFSLPKHKDSLPEVIEFPALCELLYLHNHLLDSTAVKKFRPLSNLTQKRLIELFELGHTAATARQMLQMELELQSNEDYVEACMDSSKLPSLSVVNHLLNNEFRKIYGSRRESDIDREVEKYISSYNQQPFCKAAFSKVKNSLAIAVVTLIMKRSIDLLSNVQEMIMLDASGHMDRLNHRVYFFISPGVAGGIPIGCIITNAEETNIFCEGVKLLCECFPEKCCLLQNGPLIVMTNDDLKEREVLSKIWLNSTYLLCQFHVLKAVWRWLMNSENKVLKEHRQELYFSFKSLMYAETEMQLKELLQNMLENSTVRKYDKFIIYLSKLFSKKHLWCTCHRKMLLTRGNNTTNYVESLFKVLKETILGRVKAFSLVQLLDFIVTKFEKYLHSRYLDFSFGRSNKKLVKRFLPDDKGIIQNIRSLNKDNTYFEIDQHFVDLESSICTCFVGMNGKLCKHLNSVILKQNKQSTFVYSLESRN
ncbi:uncharacterized protein LOC129956633 [Argiope bruennichi]|uniref:uncharacterized protein LOC129956633 n=1 Tax=Argiope bruennichi TaxID=94029 RepID=UPI0024951CBB|nr:uncharacterized protein LOC129956633 [Argiope bruennichi]